MPHANLANHNPEKVVFWRSNQGKREAQISKFITDEREATGDDDRAHLPNALYWKFGVNAWTTVQISRYVVVV